MSEKKEKPGFFDLSIFGLRLKPWHGLLIGVFIQMFFGGILSGLGGILIIASIISMIHKLFKKKNN